MRVGADAGGLDFASVTHDAAARRRIGQECHRRTDRGPKSATLRDHEIETKRRDARVTRKLHKARRVLHALRRGVQSQRQHADDRDGHNPLQHSRQKRQQQPTPKRALVRQHVGGDDRLAVAGAGGVKHPIREAETSKRPHGAPIALHGAHRAAQQALEFGLLRQNPPGDSRRLTAAFRYADAERIARLREGLVRAQSQQTGGQSQNQKRNAAPHRH